MRAPLRPSTILCAGSNYRAHNLEKANTPLSGKEPEFFVKTSDCVIGRTMELSWIGDFTQKLDCETELAIVIGKPDVTSRLSRLSITSLATRSSMMSRPAIGRYAPPPTARSGMNWDEEKPSIRVRRLVPLS